MAETGCLRDGAFQNLENEGLFHVNGLVLKSETLIGSSTAASVNVPLSLISTSVNTEGANVLTLADGTSVGQVKHFINTADAAAVITPTTKAGTYATVTTATDGDSVSFVWTGSTGWAILSRGSGVAAGAAAVAGLPVVA